jgi:GR25 family glycosyltransferase involved in LPS biosynthesis
MNTDKLLHILSNYDVILENINNAKDSSIDIPVYVINLKKDVYRRSYIKYITSKLNINCTLVIVDKTNERYGNMRSGVFGCYLSHMWCLKYAIEKKDNYFLILEDDVIFDKQFINKFKSINYKNYDMLQLGSHDFNLRHNLNGNNESHVYKPSKLALGAFANIYNYYFAKLLFKEKLHNVAEFDIDFENYYRRYDIGICYPNIVTTELSTTNIQHNFSIFDHGSRRYLNTCFINFSYEQYFFIWITFLEECHTCYNLTLRKFDSNTYDTMINEFSKKNKNEQIISVLRNNDLFYNDINKMIKFILTDKYN